MEDSQKVLVTGDAAKLPPEYAALIDPKTPLPAHVRLFEKRITEGQMLQAIGSALMLVLVGILATVFGVFYIFSSVGVTQTTSFDYAPLGFGVVCLFASWAMLSSLRLRRTLQRQQQRGEETRLGIFLTPYTLFEVNEFGYCIVPRAQVRNLVGTTVNYLQDGKEKSFRLPGSLISGDVAGMTTAIGQWMSAAGPNLA